MKIRVRRNHTVRPEDYESVGLAAEIEIDSEVENDKDWFEDNNWDANKIGAELSETLDSLLDTDVVRTLRLDGQRITDTHLWVFYGRE